MALKNKLPLALIILIGVLTPLSSTLLFFLWKPDSHVNIGEVLPPRELPAVWRAAAGEAFAPATWRGDWVLLSAGNAVCDAGCQRRLCRMRQLRLMLPGNYLKLRRAWLITDDNAPPAALQAAVNCGEEVAGEGVIPEQKDVLDGVEVIYGGRGTLPPAAAGNADNAGDTDQSSALYLIDPAGVWAMRFHAGLGIYEIRKDLKRLLRLSKGRRHIDNNAGENAGEKTGG